MDQYFAEIFEICDQSTIPIHVLKCRKILAGNLLHISKYISCARQKVRATLSFFCRDRGVGSSFHFLLLGCGEKEKKALLLHVQVHFDGRLSGKGSKNGAKNV